VGERLDKGGLAAALALVGAAGGIVDDTGAQVDLFENGEAPLPLPSKGKSGPQGGRPRGATNKSTDAWVSWFLSQHRSPLSVLGNLMSQDVRELHAMLQDMADARTRTRDTANGSEEVRVLVDPLAVLKLQRDAAAALLPYIHKQQPKALEIETTRRGVVLLGDLEAIEDAQSDDLALPLPPIVENQQVSQAAHDQSDNAASRKSENGQQINPLEWHEH
jgi:hypothetical protein